MIRIFEPLDFKDAKPKRKQHPYEVKPGDTLAGIALRYVIYSILGEENCGFLTVGSHTSPAMV
jgi:hypothetical protein